MAQAVITLPLAAWSKYFPRLVHVIFVVGEVALVQVISEYFFPLSVPFHQCCVLIPSSITALLNTTKVVDPVILVFCASRGTLIPTFRRNELL